MQRRWKVVLIAATGTLAAFMVSGILFTQFSAPPTLTMAAPPMATASASPDTRGAVPLSPPQGKIAAAQEEVDQYPELGKTRGIVFPAAPAGEQGGDGGANGVTNAAKDPVEDAIAHASLKSRASIEMDTDMRLYKSYLVTFAIQAEKQDGSTPALDTLTEAIPAPSIMNTTIQSSREVSATMVTGDLDHVAQDAGWKILVSNAPSIWTWEVTAKTPGEKTVMFNLEQRIKIGEKTIEVPVEQFPFIVKVRASFAGQVAATFSTVQSAAVAIAAMLGTLGTIGTACYTAWRMVRRRTRKANSRPHLQP